MNLLILAVELLVVFGYFWWTEPLLPAAGVASVLKQLICIGGFGGYIVLLTISFFIGCVGNYFNVTRAILLL